MFGWTVSQPSFSAIANVQSMMVMFDRKMTMLVS